MTCPHRLILRSSLLAVLAGSRAFAGNATPVPNIPNLPPDSEAIICNHVPPKDYVYATVRCKAAVTAGKVLLFTKGAKPAIELPIENDRPDAISAAYTLTLTDHDGTRLRDTGGSMTLAPGTATNVHYDLETADLKYGVYSLVLHVTAAGQPLTDREYYLGIISDAVIPKAPDGQFLYGLDPNFGGVTPRAPEPAVAGRHARQGQCDLLPWLDAMGVDILRGGGWVVTPGKAPLDLDPQDMAILKQHQLRIQGMMIPLTPKPGVPNGFLDADVLAWSQKAEAAARGLPEITYWEIGNEPDLGYPGGIDRYVQIFEATSEAVKRGNPQALVLNGGITFFGAKGPANSRRFIQTVKPEDIDVIAYHAHGPGSPAERHIYEQVHQAMAESGKGNKMLVDTESGVFSGSRHQEDVQAWTAVEKQVYAQSVGLKFLMSFRLHAFRSETGWGFLRSDQEPNPAVLAYRAMTEHLKGLAFQKTLTLTQANAEGYNFAEANGPRRACILWSNQPAFYNVYLKVADSANDARDLRTMDIYGNSAPVDVTDDGVARVEVTQAPTYLFWNAGERSFQASVAPSMLQTPDMAAVVPDAVTPLDLAIKNPTGKALHAVLSASITSAGSSAISPASQNLVIPAGGSLPVSLSVKWSASAQQGLAWPNSWIVYSGDQATNLDLSSVHELPTTLNGALGRSVLAANDRVDLLNPGEAPREKRLGYVFAVIQSDRDQTIRVGCAADWWMELRVNGAVVCSTLEKGNQFLGPTDRIIEIPLKKGPNVVACKILGGKSGCALTLVPPVDLEAMLHPEKAANCVDLSLQSGGKILAQERLALQPVQRISALAGLKWTDSQAQWAGVKTDFVLDGSNVTNLYDKEQDRSKWWQGLNDLSGSAWLRADEKRLYLIVWVLDDKDVTGSDPAKLADADSLQIGLAKDGPSAASFDLYSIGRVNGATVVCKEKATRGLPVGVVPASASEITAQVERVGQGTLYRVAMDRGLAGDGIFRLNFLVNDNDDGYRKQFMEWTHGLGEAQDPTLWQQFILSPTSTASSASVSP